MEYNSVDVAGSIDVLDGVAKQMMAFNPTIDVPHAAARRLCAVDKSAEDDEGAQGCQETHFAACHGVLKLECRLCRSQCVAVVA